MSSSPSHWGGKISLWLAVHCTAQWGQIPCESAFQCSLYTTKLFLLLKTKILNLFLDHRHYKITIRIQKGFGPIGHMWYSVEKRTIYSTYAYARLHHSTHRLIHCKVDKQYASQKKHKSVCCQWVSKMSHEHLGHKTLAKNKFEGTPILKLAMVKRL